MNISKKKIAEFDEIFKFINNGNFFIDIDLFRNLFESDFYDNFITHVDNKINKSIETSNIIIIHANINLLAIKDTMYYDKIIKFCKTLHKYTLNIQKIILYGNSSLFVNLIKLINASLKTNISHKLYFTNDTFEPNNTIEPNNTFEPNNTLQKNFFV